MLVHSREAAEVSGAVQGCFLKQSRVSSSLCWNPLIVFPYCGCLCIFFFFPTKGPYKNWMCPSCGQKIQSNSETSSVHKLLLLEVWFSFGWLRHGPRKSTCVFSLSLKQCVGWKLKYIYNELHPVYLISWAVNLVGTWHLLPECVQKVRGNWLYGHPHNSYLKWNRNASFIRLNHCQNKSVFNECVFTLGSATSFIFSLVWLRNYYIVLNW